MTLEEFKSLKAGDMFLLGRLFGFTSEEVEWSVVAVNETTALVAGKLFGVSIGRYSLTAPEGYVKWEFLK